MKECSNLSSIKEIEYSNNIEEMTKCFVEKVDPLKVILFGSFANGTYDNESDYDFYIVIGDGEDVADATDKAYDSILYVKNRPVDIVVGTASRFDRKSNSSHSLMFEGEVKRNGILLYEKSVIYDEWTNRRIQGIAFFRQDGFRCSCTFE